MFIDCTPLLTLRHVLMTMGRGTSGFGFRRGGHGRGLPGGDGIPGGKRLSSNDLQLVILALLEKQPSHGYELIRAIEERSNGFYVPSPGVIYPALTYLEEIGHATFEQSGNRKLYHLTKQGGLHLKENRESAEAMLEALSRIGNRMDQVREAFAGLDAVDPKAMDELHRVRHSLKHALKHTLDCTPSEARKVIKIVKRATTEILEVFSRKPT